MSTQRSGIVSIIGRPSAGKSTFLNTVCGEKVSIVSPIPQTTRNVIRGIYTDADGQIVFIDTPGYHMSEKKLNRRLQVLTEKRLLDSDCILYMLDSGRLFGEEEAAVCNLLVNMQDKIIVAVNKIDSAASRAGQTKLSLLQALPDIPADHIFEISAQEGTGIPALVEALFKMLPEGAALYPADFYTDQPVDFRIAEVIREQAIALLYDEIPHALYVRIEDMEMKRNGKELFTRAFICVERESQKAMVIGKGAAMIKNIRISSQKELAKIFPYRVLLDVQVRVDKNWRQKDQLLTHLLPDF